MINFPRNFLFYHYLELHHSQTFPLVCVLGMSFYHYLELHHSQTSCARCPSSLMFYHYLELHHSQTCGFLYYDSRRFTTIWNYITLKHEFEHILQFGVLPLSGITSLSNKSTRYECLLFSFTTIWNYITLKHVDFCITIRGVLPLSGITSLSNMSLSTFFNLGFYHYLELHHSQTFSVFSNRVV